VEVADLQIPISNFTDDYLYYLQPKVTGLSPNIGNVSGGRIMVLGEGFINTAELACAFGTDVTQTALYVSSTKLTCHAPPWTIGQSSVIAVEVSENGVDFTDDDVSFSYNIPFLGGLQLWQLISLIAGCVVGAALLIIIIAVCVYRRAREKDKGRRFLDSDTEGEVEPLIQSINSKTMRSVLAQVERVKVEELKFDRRIGRGSFGEVFHAFWAGTEIAVKKLPKHMLSNQKFLEDFAQEISIMAQLRHPNVIQFLGVAIDKVSLYMLTEFMPRGEFSFCSSSQSLFPSLALFSFSRFGRIIV
jgi:Protein tyrosine and serine/threonine kinase/IPT/TIG domain